MPNNADLPKSAIPQGWERPLAKQNIDLLNLLDLLFRHLTPALCQTVFKKVRKNERERKWTLEAIARFWTAMIIRQPPSLTHGVSQARKRGKQRDSLWPAVHAEVNAFFEKCWALRPDFFRHVYEGFTQSLLEEAPENYVAWLKTLRDHFPQIFIVDGSRLDAVCHRLKILRPVGVPVLPGCMTAFYDIFRGISRKIVFYADAAAAELPRALGELTGMVPGTLIVADRMYCMPLYFNHLAKLKLFGLFRLRRRINIKRLKVLSAKQGSRSFLEDALVEVGCGVKFPKILMRRIRYRHRGKRLDLLTSVLEPEKLSAEQAVALYAMRWSVERMFLELKKTLKLNSLFASHPNLVAQQLYATAMVYNAFRVSQAYIASQAQVLPEQLSPEKLFPLLASSSHDWAVSKRTMMAVCDANPGVKIQEPDWGKMKFATLKIADILLQHRKPHRCKRRLRLRRWRTFALIPGGPKLLASLSVG
jgi:IS4 transposase